MASIQQKTLFAWNDIEDLGDLRRLELVIETLPDESLMQTLERERKNGRDDYPVRAMWNSLLAMIVFNHRSVADLIRELSRNAQMRMLCGFDGLKGIDAVPTAFAYSRFITKLIKHHREVRKIFEALVDQCIEVFPDYGESLAIDGKAVSSYARRNGTTEDRRSDRDATVGVKSYWHNTKDGGREKKQKTWFGYKIHLVVDANYELPVTFTVPSATTSEMPVARMLLDSLVHERSDLLNTCKFWSADKGYDDGKMLTRLWDGHQIKPVIDIRNCWQNGEKTKLIDGTTNIVYDYQGSVSCICPWTGDEKTMAYGGFEKNRDTLKYRCPHTHYGVTCVGKAGCPVKGAVRIPLSQDRRIFTPLARSSHRWKEMYNHRTSVERVNSRIDRLLGLEHHTIRGLQKMSLHVTMALSVMLAVAVGWQAANHPENIRSLTKSA